MISIPERQVTTTTAPSYGRGLLIQFYSIKLQTTDNICQERPNNNCPRLQERF
jgi:hypothetical protein